MMIDDQLIRQFRRAQRTADRAAAKPIPLMYGVWTPTYAGSVTAGVTTYTTQQGAWWRKGNEFTVTGTLIWTATTATGNVRIALPFTPANITNQNFSGYLYSNGVTWANTGIQAFVAPNVALLRLFSPASNAGSTELAVEAAGELRFTAVYLVEL